MNFATYFSLCVFLSSSIFVFAQAGVIRDYLCDGDYKENPCKRCVCKGFVWIKKFGNETICLAADQALTSLPTVTVTGIYFKMEACPERQNSNDTASNHVEMEELKSMLMVLKRTINSMSRQLIQSVEEVEETFDRLVNNDTGNKTKSPSIAGRRTNVTKSVEILGSNCGSPGQRLMTVNVDVQVDAA